MIGKCGRQFASDMDFLQTNFGSWADYLYRACRGIDDRPVRPDRIRKSLGAERTFLEDLSEPDALHAAFVVDAEGFHGLTTEGAEARRVAGQASRLQMKVERLQAGRLHHIAEMRV